MLWALDIEPSKLAEAGFSAAAILGGSSLWHPMQLVTGVSAADVYASFHLESVRYYDSHTECFRKGKPGAAHGVMITDAPGTNAPLPGSVSDWSLPASPYFDCSGEVCIGLALREVVRRLSAQERSKLCEFATSSPVAPLGPGSQHVKLRIMDDHNASEWNTLRTPGLGGKLRKSLPFAATCTNEMTMPDYLRLASVKLRDAGGVWKGLGRLADAKQAKEILNEAALMCLADLRLVFSCTSYHDGRETRTHAHLVPSTHV